MIPTANRIRKSSEYSKVFKTSTKFETPNFKIYLTRSIDSTCQVGIIASGKIGGAVKRNLIKRRIKAILLPYLTTLPYNIVIRIKQIPNIPFTDLKKEIESVILNQDEKGSIKTSSNSSI